MTVNIELLNEKIIQSEVFNQMGRPRNAMINVQGVFGWEPDMLIIRRGVVTEYEIKISRQDFWADLKKTRHMLLGKHWAQVQMYPARRNRSAFAANIPNSFWYVCPEGLIKPEDVPEYAGLLWLVSGSSGLSARTRTTGDQSFILHRMKDAPKLHDLTMVPARVEKIMSKSIWRMWDLTGRLGRAQVNVKMAVRENPGLKKPGSKPRFKKTIPIK